MSNALRDAMDYVAQGQRERAQQLEAENAANSNAVSRAWTGGRITGDLNAAQIDLAAARAQEDEQKAAALQQQVDNLQQRASLYAADVGKVEDIKGLRDAFSWFGTQVGQGAASMADPMALSAGATAIGAPLARAGGTAGLIGKAIQGAGHLGAFALNQRQMAGEHYGKLAQDPAALAQLGAKGAYDQSNLVGAAGGALETILPAMAGRALGGAALKKGAAGMLGTGVGRKTLYGMAGEGATEVAQGEISRQAHAYANPERDTNGDWSDRLNEFAGGAAGGALPSAAGAVADHGYARASRAGGVVNEKAGGVVDLANKGAQRAGEMYKDSGLKGVIDLGVEGGKTLWQRAAGKNGETQAQAEATQAAVDRFALTPEEEQVFRSVPPDTEDTDALHAWVQEDSAKREAAAGRRLADLAEQGVPEAGELLQRLQDPDPVTRAMAANDAGDFLLDRHAQSEVAKEATNFAAALGSYAARGAAAAGKAAWGVGKDLASGVKQGLADGGKKNLQGTANPVLNYDTWRAWTAENGAQGGSPKHAVASAAGRAQERSADAQFAQAMKANSQHATHLGELFAAQAEEHFTSAGWQAPGIGNYARSLGYEAADMAASWLRTGSVGEAKVAGLTKDLYNTLGRDAGAVVARAAKAATPEAHGFFTQLQERLDNYTPEARRGGLGDQMVALLPAAQQQELLANGGAGANMLENTVAQISRGRVLPAKRREVERAIGADNLNKMLSLYGDTLEEGPAQAPGKVVDDRAGGAENIDTDRLSVNDGGEVDADGQASGFEQRQAERKAQRNGTPRMYMFHGQGAHTLHSTDVQGARKPRNPFDSADKPSAMLAARIEKDARDLGFMRADGSEKLPSKPRPRLVEAASPEQAGELLAKKKGEMDKMLGGEGSGHYSEVVPAKQVLDDMGSSPTERLALFRDYMFQNARRKATSEKNPDPTGAADDVLLAVQAHAMLVDEMQGKDRELGVPGGKATRATPGGGVAAVGAWVKQNLGEKAYTQFRQNAQNMLRAAAGRPTRDYEQGRAVNGVSDGDRALVMDAMERFFANNYLVQAERTDATVDRTPGEISAGEVVDMARSGARIRSAAEGAARTEGVPNNAEGGLLNFKQPGDQDLLGTNAKTLAIPVERLVGWVRSTRREESSKEDKRGADKKFVADLYEGITALQESGLVEGMPWVNGKEGPEHFLDVAKTPTKKAPGDGRPVGHLGLPDALHLPTTTGWGANKRERARKEHVREEHAVARAAGATIEGAMRRSERRRAVDVAREQAVGEVSETPAIEGAGDPYTDIVKNRVTPRHPLDRVTSPSKAGDAQTVKNQREQLDAEALDVGIRSKGIATPGFENRMSAEKKAPERADALIETFRSQDVAQGIAAVHQRLRMAQQSGRGGGIQYAWPLAHALTPKNIGMMDLSAGEARQMALARSGLANLIAGSENLSQREKVAMARAMADEAARPKITAQTAQAWLEKGAQMYRDAVAAKAEKAAKAKAEAGGSTEMRDRAPPVVPRLERPDGRSEAVKETTALETETETQAQTQTQPLGPVGRASLEKGVKRLREISKRLAVDGDASGVTQEQIQTAADWAAGKLASVKQYMKALAKDSDERYEAEAYADDLSFYAKDLRQHLAAAPEVVAAGAPKSQPSPGGAAKGEHAVAQAAQAAQGRKLSLLSTQVHNDLQKGGFAATHDSPIKHAGKFNWREHIGKGDGNAVYGAGTYLSTDEVIHRGYKKIFSNPAPGMRVDGVAQGQGTSAAPSPTYHVSVRIMPSQIMNWGAALSEQSGYVKKRLEQAGFKDPDATGAQMYHALSARLGSQAAASEHLQGLGILGHSYGSTPKRSPNYVIYDDGRIETNYVHFNKQGTSSDAGGAGSPDVLARLVSRRADARVASFPTLDGRGHSHGVSISFGPDRNEPFTHHFYNGTDGKFYSAVVPQLHDRALDTYLKDPRYAGRKQDVLSAFAVNTSVYDPATGGFDVFGPVNADIPGAKYLQDRGLLGETPTTKGGVLQRMEGVSNGQLVEFLANALAHVKAATGQDKVAIDAERITGIAAKLGVSRRVKGMFNEQGANNLSDEGLLANSGAGKFEGWKTGPTARQGSGVASDADVKAAKEYLNKVLGPKFKSEFEAITGYSGEFIEAENLIRVSTLTNAGVMNVARHEALHAFWSQFVKGNPKAQRVLASLTDDPRVLRRLQALLKDEPDALQQLTDGEERLAYIYQFAMAGQLKLPHTPGTTLMHRVRKFLRRVFMMVRDDERAVDLLYAFEAGKMSEPTAGARAVAAALNQGTWAKGGARAMDAFTQRLASLTLPATTIMANSASPTVRKLGQMFWTNPGEEGSAAGGVGYLNARNQMMRRYDNLFREAVGELDARQMSELIEAMQTEADTSTLRDPDVAAAKDSLHSLFERFHRYMTDESGVRMGRINQNYFPVVWDTQELANNPQAFKDMLLGKYAGKMERMAAAWERARQKSFAEASPEVQAFMKARGLDATITPEYVANALLENLTRADGVSDALLTAPQREDGVLRPWMSAGEERTLNFIAPEDRAPFLEKDLVKTLTRYVRQGVRTAEYSKRFGRGGAVLGKMLDDAQKELEAASHTMLAAGDLKNEKARADWVRRQFRDVSAATGAMEGSLGNDVPNWLRKTNSWMTVYQNVRLLPLALFSSFVDPLGIVAQGGDMKHAFNTFVEGIKAVARQWGDMLREEPAARKKGQWEQLAEHAGIIDGAVFSHLLNDEYGSVFHDHAAKKINDVMFKANGMDAWNRAMRVGATQAAVQFIERHSRLPEPHSARWLADLGLDAKTLPLDADGRLVTNRHDMQEAFPQMSKPEAEAATLTVHQALARWVEGAILSPNAAQRPAWMSDPHYSMFGHLKQFAYSFHTTIMKRAMNEAKHGNYTPLGVFAWYIPVMIASDVTKGLMLGAGDLPAYMKGYDLGDWMMHGVQRAGVMGMGQMAADTALHPMGMAGPAVEQIADIFMHPVEQNIIRALPVNALYRGALA